MLFSSLVSVFALAATGVHAHGYVSQIVADGVTYKGGNPNGSPKPKSPIRLISTFEPYKDPKGTGQTCGKGAKVGAMIAAVTAGSKMTLQWTETPNQAWPHEMGPLITWMAKVPAGKTAATVDPATLDYFKIQQDGQTSKGATTWLLAKLMKLNTDYTVAIPKNIENGDYIIRHEIIALHLADKKGGAEFYASCIQATVKGGTGSGAISPTVKHPGAYSATDPGIFTPKVFDKGTVYQFPGGAIPNFGASSSNSTTPVTKSTKPTATATSDAPEPTETDECAGEEPTATESAPVPTATDECSEDPEDPVEDPEESTSAPASTSTKSAKGSKPTGKTHDEYRRTHVWNRRMEKVYVGARS